MKYNEHKLSGAAIKILYGVVVVFFLAAMVRFGMNADYFQISTVDMLSVRNDQPLKYVDRQKLFEAVKPYVSGSYFDVDLEQAQNVAMQTDWVSDVKIERIAPNTVKLTIKEHEPIARWVQEGHSAGLIDGEGKVFQAAYNGKLPEFDGVVAALPQMASQYKSFSAELQPLRLSILRLQYTPRASWTMMLNNGIELRLGKQEVNTRIGRFAEAWQHSLHEQALSLDYVDMRYSDGFATKNRPYPAANTADAVQKAMAASKTEKAEHE